jgi:predicted permease
VHDILKRVEALPGVEAATISPLLPLAGGANGGQVVVDGQVVERGKEPRLEWTGVAGRWFATIGNTITNGRTFTASEVDDSAPVAVINQTMAKQLWPNGNAVGGRFHLVGTPQQPSLTVIGIASDIQVDGLDNTDPLRPMAYLPYQFSAPRGNVLIARVHGKPIGFASAIRAAIRASDPTVPVFQIETMDKVRELSYWQYGLFGWMFGIFGAIALFLAAIGVYGVISYGVSQRTHEIGVRVALGAQRRDVMGLVVRQGMMLAGIGIFVGLLGAVGVTRVVASFLFDVSATDPVSFIGVALFLAAVALVASLLPARRATAVDPIVALREE